MSELDDQFGPSISPQNGIKNWETAQKLLCFELNQDSAAQLSGLLAAATAGTIGFSIATCLTIIWAAAESGEIMFALEETIEINGNSRRPRMRGVPLHSTVKPLGHPLLVQGAPARISGELYLDTDLSNGQLTWIVNNKSGRYGLHKSRTKDHLESVAVLFRRHGLPVEIDFHEVTT